MAKEKMTTPYELSACNVICDIAKHTEEEIFGKDSIRDHAVIDSKNENAKGYQKYTVTGSQAGIIMGTSKWECVLELFHEKTGVEPQKERAMNKEILDAGHAAEDFVAKMFAKKMMIEFGETLERVEVIDDTNMYQSKKRPWQLGDFDRIAVLHFKNGKTRLVGLECKTVYNMPAINLWKEGVCPPVYEWQCRHYMATSEISAWYICACWGFTLDECAIILIRRDEDKEGLLLETEETFIKCCEDGTAPDPSPEHMELVAEYLNRLYGGLDANVLEVDLGEEEKEYLAAYNKLEELTKQKKELEKEINNIEADIVSRIVLKTNGKYDTLKIKVSENEVTEIKLKVPTFSDSIDLEKLRKENESVYNELVTLTIPKATKTTLSSIKVDGKKFDACPYIIAGGVNMDKPLTIASVKSYTLKNAG